MRQLALAVSLAMGAGCVDLGRPELGCTDHCDAGGLDRDDAQTAASTDSQAPPGPDLTPAVDAGHASDHLASGPEAGTDLPGSTGEETGPAPPPDAAVPGDAPGLAPDLAPPADAAVAPDTAPPVDAAVPPDTAPVVEASPPPPDLPPPADVPGGCSSSLLGRWRLDDGAGTAARDESCHANHGTVVNGQAGDWQQGHQGGALAIVPARMVYLRVPNRSSLNPTGALSLAIWINPTSWNAGRRHLFQKGALDNQFRVWSESNALWFNVAGLSPASIYMDLPTNGVWHHVAAVHDGANLRFYLDGTQVKTAPVTGTSQVTTDDLFIGTESASSASGDFFNGLIDEVLFYGRALTPAEVAQLAAGGAAPP